MNQIDGTKDKCDFSDVWWFYKDFTHRITNPGNENEMRIGVHWSRGILDYEDFKEKVIGPLEENAEGAEDELIPLESFAGEELDKKEVIKDGISGAPIYFDSDVKLNDFLDTAAVKSDLEGYISGKRPVDPAQPIRMKRRQKLTGQKLELKKERKKRSYDLNNHCPICLVFMDFREEEVFQSRCLCQDAPAVRVHYKCVMEQGLAYMECNKCKKQILLPKSRPKTQAKRKNSEEI